MDIFFPTAEGKISETPLDLTSQRKISFELGAKYRIKERYEALGGCAANVAVGLARLGIEAGVMSMVGDDQTGARIKGELEKNKVDMRFMETVKNKKSDLSAIIVDFDSAERTIFSHKGAAGVLKIDAANIQENDWIFLGDIHGKWEDQMENIIQLAKEADKRIVLNPRELHIKENVGEIIEAIGLCEIVFVNKDEALEIVSKMNVDASFEMLNDETFLLGQLIKLEPKIAVLTDGKRGAWATDGEKAFYAKGLEVPAVDSTGAGDSFLSGFLAAYVKEKFLEECLQWGIASSANEVQYYGAIDGLLREAELLKKTKEVEVKRMIV